MRRFLISICICSLVIFSGVMSAQERSQWGGNIGITYWYPDWSNEQSDFDSETSGVYGPVGFIHYGNFGLGLQYYSGEFDLDFPGAASKISADRSDLDLTLSYRIADIFQLSVLYKQIEFDWEQTFEVKSEITGFGVGGGFNKVFPNRLLMYGFGYYLPELDYEQTIAEAKDHSGDANGFWVEAGIGYVIPDVHLLAKIGYRFQSIDVETTVSDWTEETDGFRIDICYYF